jgi:16S rRNA (guanine1207-N2)-methyltransferase
MLQIGHERLRLGGQMIVALDYPRDQWLNELLRRIFSKVTRRQTEVGVVYLATKTEPLRKLKSYAAEFAFRDGERLIQLRTRPGVFSHRELDGGARALIKKMQIDGGLRVLDLGCGSGAVGLAAARRNEQAAVMAMDSSARAVEATLWGKERNSAGNLEAQLDCDGRTIASSSYDLVLANPPYYSDFRIADLFLKIAQRALAPGGLLLVVTKTPQWYLQRLGQPMADVREQKVGHYCVVTAEQRRGGTP